MMYYGCGFAAEAPSRGENVKVFKDLNEFAAAQGSQFGPTEWLQISQDRVNLFADATDDHQWIHVDPGAGRGRAVRRRRSPTAC